MAEDYNSTRKIHNIIMENRKKITISGVIDVESFDEQSINLDTELGVLLVKGDDIKIEKLNLDIGEVVALGEFDSIEYTSDERSKGGFFSKMFR